MTFLKSIKKNLLIVSAIYIVVGVLVVMDQGKSMDLILTIFAGGLAVVGLLNMIRYLFIPIEERYKRNDFVFGAIILALGAYLFKELSYFLVNATMIFGIAMCISGFISIQDLFDSKMIGMHKTGVYLMSALICEVMGLLSIINPFVPGVTIYVLTGIGMLFCGVSDLISNFYLAGARAKYEKGVKEKERVQAEKIEQERKVKSDKENEALKEKLKQEAKNEILEEAEKAMLYELPEESEKVVEKIDIPEVK